MEERRSGRIRLGAVRGPPAADWRLIDPGAPSRRGADNMALDQALAESVEAGSAAALRLYCWDPPCLSLGRNQVARGLYDAAAAAARGIDIVRRPTGGRAVLHDRELTYCVAVRVGELGSPRASYAAINRALVAGLRRLGVAANVVGERDEPTPADVPHGPGAGLSLPAGEALGPKPCFDVAAPGEVVAAGRKLIGSAQRREGTVLLQHGSLLLDDDQATVLELLCDPVGGGEATTPAGVRREPGDHVAGLPGPAPASPGGGPGPAPAVVGALAREARARPATLRALLGRLPERTELEGALVAGFEETLGIRLAPQPFSAAEREAARRWSELFGSAAWTWRR